jgi:O-acetylhomoserine (thiol)-lyase
VLGGSVTDTGLYDWVNFSNIAPVLRNQISSTMLGITQIRKRGLRDGGGTLSPESAHSISIGAETLGLRLEKICSNALTLAHFFEEHLWVKKVNYPGLATHLQHNMASELFHNFGGLMSFELSDKIDCLTFLNRLKVVIKSSNLGDTRTLAIPVAQTIFYELGAERRKEMGIEDSLIRLSVGIEDIEDLLQDFTQALSGKTL